MSKKNFFVILLLLAVIFSTLAAIYVKPQFHKTFQIEILKFQKVKN